MRRQKLDDKHIHLRLVGCRLKSAPIRTADADRRTQLSSRVAYSRRRCVQNSRLAHDDCRRIRSTIWKLTVETPYGFDYVNFDRYRFFNNDVIMSSLVTNLNKLKSTGDCKLGHDCPPVRSHRRHDATRLRCWQICSDCRQLVRRRVAPAVYIGPGFITE